MRLKILQHSICLLLLATSLGSQSRADWRLASPDYDFVFPEDHWAKRGFKTEWWYFTGQLRSKGDDETRFGYQFTFFRVGLISPEPRLASDWSSGCLIMGHFAITDFRSREHIFSEVVYREIPLLGRFNDYPNPLIAWSLAPPGTDGKWVLIWNGSAFDFSAKDDRRQVGLDLVTQAEKPLVFQGPGGYSRKSREEATGSLYYSLTRLRTSGTLTVGGVSYDVVGSSWMDKEFSSSLLGKSQVGWDWFSIQLNDGRDVMLYRLRDRLGEADFASGTVVSPAGEADYLGQRDWKLLATDWWRSLESEARYPAGWRIEIPEHELRMEVVPRVPDQENRSRLVPGLSYWEGAVVVRDESGQLIGTGYVELTGYQENGRLPL